MYRAWGFEVRALRLRVSVGDLQVPREADVKSLQTMFNVGAFIVTIGFWGIPYYSYKQEPQKIVLVIIQAHIATQSLKPFCG